MKSGTRISDGANDWGYGIDSSVPPTIRSEANPNGLPRNALSWLVNGTVRNNGIQTRTGWQPLCTVDDGSHTYEGGWMYEPDGALPYMVLSIGGRIFAIRVDTDNSVQDITGGLPNPPGVNSHFAQGEQFLVIRPSDGVTLPLFWDGTTMKRSNGITGNLTNPNINQIPAGNGPLVYYQQRMWYANNRNYGAGDIVGGPSGTPGPPYFLRDSILSVTENPLVIGGDGFTVPTNAGNIRALAYPITLDQTLGQGPLFVFTPKQIYAQSVPITRTDWIAATSNNQPLQQVVMNGQGAVGDRCVVPVNGDLFFQDRLPSINSFTMALRYFQQWGNRPVSNNIQRALQFNNRGLMRTASGIVFDNRLWQTILPQQSNVGVTFQAIAVLDLDPISTLKQDRLPAWEGIYEGINFLQLFEGDFGGLHRAFAVVQSKIDGSLEVWEMTLASRTEDGDKRTLMLVEMPAFDFSRDGSSLFELKEIDGGILWLDKISGTIDVTVTYRTDQGPCEYDWTKFQKCFARTTCEVSPAEACYPEQPLREGFLIPVALPKPKSVCQPGGSKRESTYGFTFQPVIRIKGFARIRGIELFAISRDKPPYWEQVC